MNPPSHDPTPPRRSVQERNRLVERHLAFAESFVRKRYGRTNAPDVLDDLIQIALEALIRAADRWDETKGSFRSYAKHFIHSACFEYLVNHQRPTRLPKSQYQNRQEHRCTTTSSDDLPGDAVSPEREPPPTPEEILLDKEAVDTLLPALDSLTSLQRETIKDLYGIDRPQRTIGELADSSGVSVQAVSNSHQRALRKLRKILEETD